jgi:hypothetical protein
VWEFEPILPLAAPYEIATPVLAFDDLQNLLSDDRAIAGS